MPVIDLQTLYDYGYWANRKLLAVVAQLSPDEFTRPVAGSYGSIRNTLVHMLSAEAGWLERCGGPKRGPKLDPVQFPTFASVAERWERVERQMREFLATLSEEDLSRRVEFAIQPGAPVHLMRLDELLQHAAVHGVHHRGQVALLLRELGHAPGNVDLLLYFMDKGVAA